MASLIENLMSILEKENDEYQKLLALSIEKTGIIVKGDVNALNEIVAKEQAIVDVVSSLEKKRMEASSDIALVLNRKPEELTLKTLADMLASRPKESEALHSLHDKLKKTMSDMVRVNENNKALLQESIDMTQFEINLAQSIRQAPTTANYSGTAYADNEYASPGYFDAKQ